MSLRKRKLGRDLMRRKQQQQQQQRLQRFQFQHKEDRDHKRNTDEQFDDDVSLQQLLAKRQKLLLELSGNHDADSDNCGGVANHLRKLSSSSSSSSSSSNTEASLSPSKASTTFAQTVLANREFVSNHTLSGDNSSDSDSDLDRSDSDKLAGDPLHGNDPNIGGLSPPTKSHTSNPAFTDTIHDAILHSSVLDTSNDTLLTVSDYASPSKQRRQASGVLNDAQSQPTSRVNSTGCDALPAFSCPMAQSSPHNFQPDEESPPAAGRHARSPRARGHGNTRTHAEIVSSNEVKVEMDEDVADTSGFVGKSGLLEEVGLSSADEFDENDIDSMLEKPMKDYDAEKSKWAGLKEPPDVREKIVLKYRGTEYFEVLPDGWIEITHSCGLPVFLHKASRVCTFSRPYFIGPGSVRHHEVPMATIPCLYQKQLREWQKEREQRAKDAELAEQAAEAVRAAQDQTNSGDRQASHSAPHPRGQLRMPHAEVCSANDFKKRHLTVQQLRDYAEKGFEFEKIKVWRFKNWSDHRMFHKKQKRKQRRPTLPANMKLITVPSMEKAGKPHQKQFFLNPHGKSSVSLLHEYVQRVMHCSPVYDYSSTNNAAQPFSATVSIQNAKYATGHGNSKKTAKVDAAKRTLAVLIPDMDFNDVGTVKLPNEEDVLELFDLFTITDSRVHELSTKASQPTPYQILLECLKRNSAFGDTKMACSIRPVKHQQHEFTMSVGSHEAKVLCSNKKEGKQKASQAMLQKLHPHISTWGSLIRLYGFGTLQRTRGQTKSKDDDVVALQAQAATNHGGADTKDHPPNKAILDKLRQEMFKLMQEKANRSDVARNEQTQSLVAQALKHIRF